MNENKSNGVTISKRLITIIGVLLAIIIGLLVFMVMENKNSTAGESKNSITTPHVGSGVISGTTKSDIQAELDEAQRKVDESMLSVEISPNPTFPSGTEMGKIFIQNPESNKLSFGVQFALEETDEVVYTSGLLPVGSRIEEAILDVDLNKGEYPAVAYFTSYDAEGQPVGQTGLSITIIVQN